MNLLYLRGQVNRRQLHASHFSATRLTFKKKGNLARGQITFEYCDGAEGGIWTRTGFPTTPSRWRLLARGLQSVRFPEKH